MKRFLRTGRYILAVVVALAAALFGYVVYTPAPQMPNLSGTLTRASIDVGGLSRTYLRYLPRGVSKGAPLVLVLHGGSNLGDHRAGYRL
jgi:polyhydroxybutyrate depolymerase